MRLNRKEFVAAIWYNEADSGLDELFEYEDSHCSCNGFTFNPQSVTREYLEQRAARHRGFYEAGLLDAVKTFLGHTTA